MTIDLQVWAGSLLLIRLGRRPVCGPSLPPLLLHFLLVLAPFLMSWTQVRSSISSIYPSELRALTVLLD